MKLYHYTCHEVSFEDTGYIVAESLEQAKVRVKEMEYADEYLAIFVEEVEIEGYEIKVNKLKGED